MRTVVGVLRGGPSSEYEVSLKSGANVLAMLSQEKYEPVDIFIDRTGQWHLHGAPVLPERALRNIDVAFNIVHGEYGEDGQLQRILEAFNIPYTGPNASTAALAFNKHRTKEVASSLGVQVAHGVLIDSTKITDLHKTALNIFRAMPHPMIVKPVVGGSSLGVTKVEHFDALPFALERAFAVAPQALVEEFISGREATVGVIDDFRGEKIYALMPVQIELPTGSPFYDYQAKYGGESRFHAPGYFSSAEKHQLQHAAKAVHQGLGLRHASRSDFIVGKRGVHFLETETSIDLGPDTEMTFALQAVGASVPHFLDHIINLARKTK